MKRCTSCKIEKEVIAFSKDKYTRDGLCLYCKECNGRRGKQYRKTNIVNRTSMLGWLIARFKDVPCMDCNVIYPWHVMDFDHRLDEQKSFTIARKGSRKATPERIAEVMKEIAKCDLVCANCHRDRTYKRNQA